MPSEFQNRLHEARTAAASGGTDRAEALYVALAKSEIPKSLRAEVLSDWGVLAATAGDPESARTRFEAALVADPACAAASANLALLDAERGAIQPVAKSPARVTEAENRQSRGKVAVLSFLFNWPSTGGGIVHTVELVRFLSAAGYDVRHIFAHYVPWQIGLVDDTCPIPGDALEFTDVEWNLTTVKARFRAAVAAFAPDAVIITDSWNMKPHLADAVADYPYLLRLQALECLCPLNNLRLLSENGRVVQCQKLQLAHADDCLACLKRNNHTSGSLHQAERALSEVWTPEYRETLTRAFRNARAVLAVNEESAALLRPYNGCVRVVTAGMDPARFPWPPSEGDDTRNEKTVLFFAGLVTEPIKGFPSLLEACRMLWRTRQDFELRVTCDPGDLPADAFLRGIGWQSQEQLAACYRRADVTLVTPIAQEGLGRTAVEAGAAGRPVVASRIGGLNDVVEHGVTGLHVDPGNAADIAETLAVLLDRPELRRRMGAAGRRRFERRYPWPTIIERHYDPLLSGEALAQRKMDRDGTEPRLGCVLAIRNRPADVLKRTLETYDFQSVTPHDRLLLDYGSDDESAGDYQRLCDEYGWRYVAADPKPDRWFLSDAYNRAVAALDVSVEVVFKNDVDVLLGEGVLERAARLGREHLCLFSCVTTHAATRYPKTFTSSNDVAALLHGEPPPVPMPGEGLHAFPKAWFERIGGLDLSFEEWGFEDSDLRQRARWSIGVARDSESLLVHQWHPRTDTSDGVTANGARHERMKFVQRVVRNRGQLVPAPTSGDEDPLADMDVIVKTFLRPEALRRLLTSIREFYPTLSVTVADDGGIREAGDAASRACCRLIDGDPHTKLLELPFDTGPDEGRNALIRNTDAPFLLLLDDDYCFTQETRVETLLERLKTDQTLGGVGGSCVDVSDRGRVPRRFAGTLTRRGEELVHAVGEFHDSDLKTCDVTLQFAIFRRNVFDRVRWEGGPGAHHYDLFLQLLETDWKVAQEDSVVVHHYHDTPSLPGYRTRRDSTAAAQQWLLEKWGLERITMDGRVVCEKRKPTSKVRHGVQVRRLEIGPGQKPLPGFETLDVNGAATYTARWGHDRLTGIIPPGSYDEVYASHVLEHVLWNRTDAALRDVFEVLTPGGRFEVWVPDFEYIVRCYQERMCGDGWRRDNPAGDPMLWVNGRIFTYGPGPENLHHACFDYEHLSVCLSRAGFVAIERIEKRTRGTSHGAIDLGVTCLRPN